jgi:hypothetical protein
MKIHDQLRFSTLARYLIPVSLLYLGLPYAIFFAGWLRWYYALPCIGLVALPLLYAVRDLDEIVGRKQEQAHGPTLKWRHVALVFLAALPLLGISGVGGFGFQDTDWLKHNAILKDLVTRPWPVVYELGGQRAPLVYYVAYYLPAALLGKIGGWTLANQVLFVWSLIGLVLALLWFLVLARRATLPVVLLFVLFSGLDVVGQWIARSAIAPIRPEIWSILRWDHIEQWSIGWQYSSNVTLLFWVPNQVLAGWIATGLLVGMIFHPPTKASGHMSLFYCGLTALWSPFVTIGLLPYLLVECLLEGGSLSRRLRRYTSLPNLCGLALLAVVGLFYSAKLYEVSPLLTSDIPHGFSLKFAPDTQAKMIGLALILIFCTLEFGLFATIIRTTNQDWSPKTRILFATTLICLSLIPFYRYGGTNDFVMRVSIPALFVLAVFLCAALHSRSLGGPGRTILVILVILGAVTPLVELRRHVTAIHDAGTILQTPAIDQVRSISRWGLSGEQAEVIVLQYVGSSQAPFFRFLTKGHQANRPSPRADR